MGIWLYFTNPQAITLNFSDQSRHPMKLIRFTFDGAAFLLPLMWPLPVLAVYAAVHVYAPWLVRLPHPALCTPVKFVAERYKRQPVITGTRDIAVVAK